VEDAVTKEDLIAKLTDEGVVVHADYIALLDRMADTFREFRGGREGVYPAGLAEGFYRCIQASKKNSLTLLTNHWYGWMVAMAAINDETAEQSEDFTHALIAALLVQPPAPVDD
jgi:hypothetical protein